MSLAVILSLINQLFSWVTPTNLLLGVTSAYFAFMTRKGKVLKKEVEKLEVALERKAQAAAVSEAVDIEQAKTTKQVADLVNSEFKDGVTLD